MSAMHAQTTGSPETSLPLLEEVAMPCQLCRGKMVYEVFYDCGDGAGHLQFHGWRCLSCGNIWDQVIAANQSRHGYLRPDNPAQAFPMD